MSAISGRSSSSSQPHRQEQNQHQQQHDGDDDATDPSTPWYEVEQMVWKQEVVDGMLTQQPTESITTEMWQQELVDGMLGPQLTDSTDTEGIESGLLQLASSPRPSDAVASPPRRVMDDEGGTSITTATASSSHLLRGAGSPPASINTEVEEEESQGPPRSIIQHNDQDFDEDSPPLINLDSMERAEPQSEASSLNADASYRGGQNGFCSASASDGKSWLNIASTSSSKGSQGSYADQVPALSGSHSTTNLVLQQPLGKRPLYHEPPPTPSARTKRAGEPPIINLVDLYPEDPANVDDDEDAVDLVAKSQRSDLDDILGPNGEPLNSDLDDILGPQDRGVDPKYSEQSESLDSTLGPYISDAAASAIEVPRAGAGDGKAASFRSEYTHFASSSHSELNAGTDNLRPPPLSIAPPYSSYFPAETTARTHTTYDNMTSAVTPSQTRRAINAIGKSLAERDTQSSAFSPTASRGPSILPEASPMFGGEASALLREDASTAFDTACEDSVTDFTYSETPVTSGGDATQTTRSRTQHTFESNQTQRTQATGSSQPSSELLMDRSTTWESKDRQPSAGRSVADNAQSSNIEGSLGLTDGTSQKKTDPARRTLSSENQSSSTHGGDEELSPSNHSSIGEESSRGHTISRDTSTFADRSRSSRTRDFAISPCTSTSRGGGRKSKDTLSPESSSTFSRGTFATSSRGVDTYSQGIDTFSRGDTLSPSTRASSTFSPGESICGSETLSPGESNRLRQLQDRFGATDVSSRGGTFSPSESSSRSGTYTPTESKVGTFSHTERSSRVGTMSPSESSHGTSTHFTYGSEADVTRTTASNLSQATSGESPGTKPEGTRSRISTAASGANSLGIVSVEPSVRSGGQGAENNGADGIGGRMWRRAEFQAQKTGDKPLTPQSPKFAESIMARTRSRADPDAVVDTPSNLGEIERPQSMINLIVQDEGFLIENAALARKRVRVVQLLTVGLAAFLIAFLGGFWVQSSCYFVSAVVQVGQNAEIFHLRFGLWKYSPIDSAFQGYTYCSQYDGNTADAPWFGRSASLIALIGGAYAICVLWVYLVLGRCRQHLWKAAVISAAVSGALQLSTLSIFAGAVCRQGECTLGPAGVLSIVASCVYFILAFEMHYNTPLLVLSDGLSPVGSRDEPHNLVANLEITDFEYGAKACVQRLTFGDANPYPPLNQHQRQRDQLKSFCRIVCASGRHRVAG